MITYDSNFNDGVCVERKVRMNNKMKPEHYQTIIKKFFIGSGTEGICKIDPPGDNNSTAEFELDIPAQDQIEIGKIKMHGPIERGELIEFLEAIVNEMKLMELE